MNGIAVRWALSVLLLALGCGDDPVCDAPRVDVFIDSDESLRARASELRVTVQGGGVLVHDESYPIAGLDFPVRIELRPRFGDASRTYRLDAALVGSGGGIVAELRADSGYVAGACAELRLRFDAACEGEITCATDESCVEGTCESACTEPSQPGEVERSAPVACAGGAECEPIASMDQGLEYGCAITEGSRLFCWGDNTWGQQGLRSMHGRDPQSPPKEAGDSATWEQIHLGYFATVGTKRDVDENIELWAAGDNRYGLLGQDDRPPEPGSSGSDYFWHVEAGVERACVGWGHACAIDVEAGAPTLVCWGDNDRGQRGAGDAAPTNVLAPVPGGPDEWVDVACGRAHTCALGADRSLWCWGANDEGQLGIGNTTDAAAPTRLERAAGQWVSVRAGGDTTCGALDGGSLLCWGAGFGAVPTDPLRDTDVRDYDVSVREEGPPHVCAIRDPDGALVCFGDNGSGQLGVDGAPGDPVEVPGRFERVRLGGAHTCGLDADGALFCWGDNARLQLSAPGPGGPAPQRVCIPR